MQSVIRSARSTLSTVARQAAFSTVSFRCLSSTPTFTRYEGKENAYGDKKTALVLHGIMGNKGNWRTFANRLAKRYNGWDFVCVDLRNHGDFTDVDGPHTLEACAHDLVKLGDDMRWGEEGGPHAVIGHSFGGKVAMQYLQDSHVKPEYTWVLDAIPYTLPLSYGKSDPNSAQQVMEFCAELPATMPDRNYLIDFLMEKGTKKSIALWMTTNLERDAEKGGYRLKFNAGTLQEMYTSYASTEFHHFLEEGVPEESQLHFVRGGKSYAWQQADVDGVQQAADSHDNIFFHLLPTAGHWVHTDDPDGLISLLDKTFALQV
uniref:AB hydrolase-1 domain-containing protein n=1 Tax=Palpitomonas bilix TaxID=652834 RepID=A0A7S3GLL4_9EUKA|mmetsp:Transcript_8670/g.23333  ORF Transcript_8670/g.23333 Transcript_8670/m.23333 type:complete len:318 (+) Transcript_8670:122-1075(+)